MGKIISAVGLNLYILRWLFFSKEWDFKTRLDFTKWCLKQANGNN